MGTEKIKPELNGVAETMLLTFYARAQYSKSKKHAFYDAKAVELVERLDYDFSSASKDVAMGGGTIARTLVFDELVRDFLQKHPDAVVVAVAVEQVQYLGKCFLPAACGHTDAHIRLRQDHIHRGRYPKGFGKEFHL